MRGDDFVFVLRNSYGGNWHHFGSAINRVMKGKAFSVPELQIDAYASEYGWHTVFYAAALAIEADTKFRNSMKKEGAA